MYLRSGSAIFLRALLQILLIGMAGSAVLQAQETPLPPFRFGGLLGININAITLDATGIDPYDPSGRTWGDDDAGGGGGYVGGFFSYVPGTFGLQVRAAFDGRGGRFIQGGDASTDVTADLSYFSVEPALRVTPGPSGFHFVLGPSLNFRVSDKIVFPDITDPTSPVESPIIGSKGSILSMFGGVGYDIALSEDQLDKSAWILTPFADLSYIPEQNGAVDRDWSTTTIRLGVGLSYAFSGDDDKPIAQTPPGREPLAGGFTLEVITPNAASGGSRQLDEYFPLLNYLFFSPTSTDLPESYRRLTPRAAITFRESDLLEEGPTSGPDAVPSRAAQQLRVYDNAVNIVGARMREKPGTSVSLVGADSDPARAQVMAEGVKSYLTSTFGIDPSRITTSGVTRAPHASGTRSTPAEDNDLIYEENRRVEMLSSDNALLKPVRIKTTDNELVENDLLFKVALTGAESLREWDLIVEGETSSYSQAYGPFYTGVARVNSTPFLASDQDRFRAIARATTHSGNEIVVEETFSIRESADRPTSATRFSILFEYDDSKSVSTYEEFLRTEVAPAIPTGSTVYVFGHTDATGRESYNRELSARRASETGRILRDALSKLGRSATFDSYGFGETAFRAPFGNRSPEERYYNRTVIIEIVPPNAP